MAGIAAHTWDIFQARWLIPVLNNEYTIGIEATIVAAKRLSRHGEKHTKYEATAKNKRYSKPDSQTRLARLFAIVVIVISV